MPSKPCLRCGDLTTDGSYCTRHRPVSLGGSSAKRGNGWARQRWAREVRAKTGGACARCGSPRGVQAHHVLPMERGGHPRGEGIPLCTSCHRWVHRALAVRRN